MNKYIFKIALVMMLLIAPMFMPQQEHYVAADATVINVDGGSFQLNVDKTATLVILDDINDISYDIEIWKALTVSEPTNIRSPYHKVM